LLPYLLLAVCLLSLPLAPATAEESNDVIVGKVVDSREEPAFGFRVVFREFDDVRIALSQPTDGTGEYTLALPSGTVYVPTAVISPDGTRIALENQQPVNVAPGVRRDIVLALSLAVEAAPDHSSFAGSDRLFLSFAEDSAVVAGSHWEGQLDYSSYDSAEHFIARAVAAMQFKAMPRMEFGARFGIGDASRSDDLEDGSGSTDLDLWAKLYIGPRLNSRTDFAAGALLTLGTGDEEVGLGYGALRSKIFGAMRRSFASWELTANAGLRFNEGVIVHGVPLKGEVAPSVGLGAVVPFNESITLVGEATWEGGRFDSFDADSRLLAGVNWKIMRHGLLRLAVSGGLQDGAPDFQILAGYAFEFSASR
jgi:hypothetical protein